MDYKEKYEEALERCKKEFNFNNLAYSHEEIRQRLERVFPELKENKDDKIRKELIKVFEERVKHSFEWKDGIPNNAVLAWLEKQGKKIDAIENFDTEFERQISHLVASTINKEYEYTSDFVKWTANALLNYAKHELEKQGEQNIANKVEQKFHKGDWITIDNPCEIMAIDGNYIVQYCDDEKTREISKKFCESQFHLWTIRDAKDGDVIAFDNSTIVIFKDLYNATTFHSYCHIEDDIFNISKDDMPDWWRGEGFHPATKEQRDLFFQKMKEAGYEWDSEKKELKKIKQEQTELPNGEDYGIDSLYHAARILEKTLGDVEGYQSDDGILEHKCAIEAVNRLYKQKPAWSEEDENMLQKALSIIRYALSIPADKEDDPCFAGSSTIDWLKSLKRKI